MLEQSGTVMAVEPGAVWVQTRRQSTCGSCSVRAGCGHGVLDRFQQDRDHAYILARTDRTATVGDEVVIGIPESAVIKMSALVYLLPLLGLLIGLWGTDGLAWGEPGQIIGALGGLFLGFIAVYVFSRRSADNKSIQPIVTQVRLKLRNLDG